MHSKQNTAMQWHAKQAMHCRAMSCNVILGTAISWDANHKQCNVLQSTVNQCKAMQSRKIQSPVTALSFFHTAMPIKARQGNAEQCKAFVLSVSSDERKPPNWGRAGLIHSSAYSNILVHL